MGLKLIVPPERAPVTLAEVKLQLNIEDNDEDAVLEGLITAATAALDGPNGDLCGRALMPQTWEWSLDAFPSDGGFIEVPLPPLIAVNSIEYTSTAESPEDVTLDPSGYFVDDLGEHFHARIALVGASTWPTAADDTVSAVRVNFTAGYLGEGESPAESPADENVTVPEPIRQAIILLVRDMYGQGSAFVDRAQTPTRDAVEYLIRHWVLRIV